MDDPGYPHLASYDGFPNSPLPLVIYRSALAADPTSMERAFAAQGWLGAWRNGIFRYHHFHSIAHEVLGIAAGHVRVLFGGPAGQELALQAGAARVIPARGAQFKIGHSPAPLIVGAYPGGAGWDICRGDPAELDAVRRAVAAVPQPEHDPIPGHTRLHRLWPKSASRAD